MKDLKKFLLDILDAIEGIQDIAVGLSLQDMEKRTIRWSLERGISIIGEALYKADKLQKDLPITNLQRIKATRHTVVHDYDMVDKEQIFIIVQKHIPVLKSEVESILKKLE